MRSWWTSIRAMRRFVQLLALVAAAGFVVAITTWPGSLAVGAVVIAAAAVLGTLFTWFRLDDLRNSERLGR